MWSTLDYSKYAPFHVFVYLNNVEKHVLIIKLVLLQDQDPASFPEATMMAMRNATVQRYELLPFLYTLFARAVIFHELPIRPLFMVYVRWFTSRSWDCYILQSIYSIYIYNYILVYLNIIYKHILGNIK